MSQGFVYVLFNPSIDGQVKLGRTTGTSEERAADLSTPTGVPTPFVVLYDELVSDCKEVERRLHNRFAGYRVRRAREFFRIPIREAIRALQEEAAPFRIATQTLPNRVEILPELRAKYGGALKPNIVSVAILQLPGVCFLEMVRRMYAHSADEIVERTDLSFIVLDHDQPMFPTSNNVLDNARTFVESMDPISIINCTNLFTEEAAQRAYAEWSSKKRGA